MDEKLTAEEVVERLRMDAKWAAKKNKATLDDEYRGQAEAYEAAADLVEANLVDKEASE